ncbi:hypothetical protein Tco_0075263 [Tanacetum coccineum]
MDSDFTLSSDSLGSDLVVSFPYRTRNKIFDPGIFIGVQFKIFLSRDAFSISFIRDPLFDTLLPFLSEKEDKVVNTGILVVGEEQSPLFSYVVWIFLAFLTYLVSPPYLLSIGNEDTILTLASLFIILLCRVGLIGVELS